MPGILFPGLPEPDSVPGILFPGLPEPEFVPGILFPGGPRPEFVPGSSLPPPPELDARADVLANTTPKSGIRTLPTRLCWAPGAECVHRGNTGATFPSGSGSNNPAKNRGVGGGEAGGGEGGVAGLSA